MYSVDHINSGEVLCEPNDLWPWLPMRCGQVLVNTSCAADEISLATAPQQQAANFARQNALASLMAAVPVGLMTPNWLLLGPKVGHYIAPCQYTQLDAFRREIVRPCHFRPFYCFARQVDGRTVPSANRLISEQVGSPR